LVGFLVASLLTATPATSSTSVKLNSAIAQAVDVQLLSSDYTFYVRGTDIPNPLVTWAVKPIDQVFLGAFGPGVAVPYPASVGWLGVVMGGFLQGKFHYPMTQDSVSQGQKNLDSYVKSVRAGPKATVTIVSLSQGSLVANAEALALRAEGTDTTGIRFVAAGDPARANGGLAARLPFQIKLPGLFIAGGDDINSNPPPTNGAKFVLVTNQYDPFADVPLYLNKPIALANWALSFVAGGLNAPFPGVGPHTYDYTPINPEDPAATPGAIVKTYGSQTDVLLPSPKGYLPITGLLRGIVSQPLIDAVDPFLRSIIETAYDRNRDVAERSRFQWAPPQSQREANLQSVVNGFNQMVSNLKELSHPTPQPVRVSDPVPSSVTNSTSVEVSVQTQTKVATDTSTTASNTASSPQRASAPKSRRPAHSPRLNTTSDDSNATAKAPTRGKHNGSRAAKRSTARAN